MVDVLSTRLQEVYAKWESRTEVKRNLEPSSNLYTIGDLRRASHQVHKRRIQDRIQAKKIRENSLFKIKESEPLVPLVKEKPSFLRYCCSDCTPSSRDSLVHSINKQHMPFGLNVLVVNPGPTLLSKVFNCISHVCSRQSYDYAKVTQMVLNDERLEEAIKLTALESVNNDGCSEREALAKAKDRAKTILLEMESGMSNVLLKIITWLLYKLLPCFLQSAIVLPSQIEMLKTANETGLPLIFLPLHRSHLDYIMISFTLLINNIRSPLIAAGDNLKIPVLGWILRGLGAFFIKRRIDPVLGRKDVLYRATLHTYIMENLRAGHNIEFFIEGGRTRTGKPCMPKGGILSVIIDAYMDGIVEDALLVPVTMNYERLVDGNFVREQLGQPKKMETFRSTVKAMWDTLKGNYGIVKVDFCQPFSLREMLKSFQAQQNRLTVDKASPTEKTLKYTMSSSSLYGTDVIIEEHRQLVDSIARHVVYDCSMSTPIMSTNVVAFLLLNKFRDGCTLDALVEAFDSMRQELELRDKDIAFCGESIDIIHRAMEILGPGLIQQQRQEITEAIDGQPFKSDFITAIRPVSILPNVIELSYYSNALLTCYVMDSIVVTALYAELQSQINDPVATAQNNITVSKDPLIQRSLKLCDILKYEFIFCKPCQELERAVIDAVENLAHMDIITLQEQCCLEEELWSRRFAQTFDDSSDEEYIKENKTKNIQYKLNLLPEYVKRMEFLHTLLRPLIDTYTFSAFTLNKIVGRSLTERDLVQEVLSELKTNLDRGIVNYGESLCVDPIKNSLKLFEKWNVLECHPQENIKIFYLKDEYDTDSAVTTVYETIAAFKWTRNIN
ncbi:glycerol-3-phosphate acyltransferase mino isoform X2 [Nomia melanderi]|nr:glycerol-3-phosphate acyltransferase 1, mitochondrial isoform X2 [Nomia melanderi]XP_031842921.1 glycerol-3-phosphate acyltransferase 1, mitochondrial isoform X2 [Nomia melanderi]XP_031842923.1 glycerol-3-phosphate acyltransferase 1, mitochondrial isoform X2 [Nomia melanderi]XP_031842924.1 glycerol-3-phosphate acyltransferase 1, mitochondrial isoform X2 [Nomia melanderi]XP_031842925.1 glycerol-3-phosphate acyltransferase 1, mitochondrial isoform X2 [Nomia melanderi]XP_031842926.1 glycerol-3